MTGLLSKLFMGLGTCCAIAIGEGQLEDNFNYIKVVKEFYFPSLTQEELLKQKFLEEMRYIGSPNHIKDLYDWKAQVIRDCNENPNSHNGCYGNTKIRVSRDQIEKEIEKYWARRGKPRLEVQEN